MSEFVIEAQPRTITGKKVKQLRREGLVPGIVYGPDSEPLPIQMDRRELRQVLLQAGGTQLIEVQMKDEMINVLARYVQRDIVRGDLLHIDFYRVAMDRTIRADVPIVVFNEPSIVTGGTAVVLQTLNTLEIETLPAEIPPQIEVDISELEEIGDQILVEELDLGEGIIIHTGAEELVVKIDYPRQLEVEEEEEDEELLEMEPAAGDVEVITERRDEEEEE